MQDVVVIGGGFAGLAAAVALAERGGIRPIVLEERPHLGGRAYSFRDEESGETVDNGQHAMMGCYRQTLAFLDRIGAGGKVWRQENLRVDLLHPARGAGAITARPLPSPLHAAAGILGYGILSRAERLQALLAGVRLMGLRHRRDPRLSDGTVAEVLRALGQGEHARASFWNPVAIATLNEDPERAAAAPFAEVLARAFFGSRRDSQFVLPAVGLSELYTADARRFVEARGGEVRLRARVVEVGLEAGEPVRLRLANGEIVAAGACIAAVPPRVLDRILPDGSRRWLRLPALDRFETSPIVSAHLRFDRPVLGHPFLGLLGTTTHWLFDRAAITAGATPPGDGAAHSVSAVISAAREAVAWEPGRIAETMVADLRALVPAAGAARLLGAVVVKEKHATISPTPAAERLRPPVRTPLPNFCLAGDWVATGLPPTIESAVASGEAAAEIIGRTLATEARSRGGRLALDGSASVSPRLRGRPSSSAASLASPPDSAGSTTAEGTAR